MNWTEIRKCETLEMPGLKIERTYEGDALTSMILTPAGGQAIRLSKEMYGGMKLFRPEPPPPKYRVVGTISGIPIAPQVFDNECDAAEVQRKLDRDQTDAAVRVEKFTEENDFPF